MNYGKAIKHLRQDKNINQTEFAGLIGITQTYLSQIENGKKTPSTEILERVAEKAEVPMPILFWYGMTEADVIPAKREIFNQLAPMVNQLIISLF